LSTLEAESEAPKASVGVYFQAVTYATLVYLYCFDHVMSVSLK